MKRFTPYGAYVTGMCMGGLVFLYACALFGCYFFPTHTEGGWEVAVLFATFPLILTIAYWRCGILRRLLLITWVDEQGFHCKSLFHGTFSVPWGSIHTYGIAQYSVSYINAVVIFFSQNPSELAPKNIQEINVSNRNRLAFQYRKEIWNEIYRYMPIDMKKNFDDAFAHQRGGFFKR